MYLFPLIYGYRYVQSNGVLQTQRDTLNLIGATVVDNQAQGRTDVYLSGVGGGGITALVGDVKATGPGSVAGVVQGLQTFPISTTAPSLSTDTLRWNGVWYAPAAETGGGSTPSGTGFVHITGGTQDGTARAVNLSTADVVGFVDLGHMAHGAADSMMFTNHAGTAPEFRATAAVPTAITLESYGAVGDGVTNDSAAMVAAVAALSSGGCILLGAKKTYLIGASSPYSLPAGSSIIGCGDTSILKTATNAALLVPSGNNGLLSKFKMQGGNNGSSQYGFANRVPGSGTHYTGWRLEDISVDNMGEAGIILLDDVSSGPPPFFDCALVNIKITNCPTYGLWNYSDYTTCVNLQADACGEGIRSQGGNQTYASCTVTDNTVGFHLVGGGNDGHGEVVGLLANHNTTNLLVDNAVANGMPFVGCSFYGSGDSISLVSSNGVRFIGCSFDVDNYYFDGSKGTVFDGCLFPQNAGTNTIHNNYNSHASTTRWMPNNVDLTGNFPSFIRAGDDATSWTAPVWTGSGFLTVGGGSGVYRVSIGPEVGAPTAAGCVWILPSATAPSSSNFVLQSDGSDCFINAPSTVMYFAVNTSVEGQMDSTDGWQFAIATQLLNGSTPATPVGGPKMFGSSGALKAIGTGGTIATMCPAEPHCPVCGTDFTTEHESERYGYLAICLVCLADELGERPWIRRSKS